MSLEPRGVINHYLYFPSEEAAQRAAKRLVTDGYDAEVRDTSDTGESNPWLTYATARLPESDDEFDLVLQR